MEQDWTQSVFTRLWEFIVKLDKLTDVQSDLLKTKQELLESTGLYAKQKFREHGLIRREPCLIRREPCLWCVTPPEQITAELLL